MRIDILTLFPGMFGDFLGESIIKRAREKGKADIRLHNIRSYSTDKHRKADDRPFGGGPGMVLQVEPIYNALKKIVGAKRSTVILMSPRGKRLEQKQAKRFAKLKRLAIICGHYEGVDERVKELLVDYEISIGDYVLTCGELPAMVLVDAVVRLIPGVLGDGESTVSESFENDLLEYPQYTRPSSFCGMKVPDILLSGDHERIAAWRMKEAVKRTKKRRPDLLKKKE
ncbi:MAG: tRNA (guanosine(37)-N1)-methyltransferase TrmD [Candidatus Omnitrophica bacterium]|nr:tRNA (guanosine(37)-N1)-methyltransferase TrmD [Candidatus Omnitrophota bacterium]MBU4488350.1 tRNA (guanosine(37)-N1)-methyltransferase TrmD [Candidatus Omnitrophota bacterium]MCG2705760.1 tRNA (guanosine(37)-N1)-methyltransferase TrmD [Candidatus Omnitrophota bacterium]